MSEFADAPTTDPNDPTEPSEPTEPSRPTDTPDPATGRVGRGWAVGAVAAAVLALDLISKILVVAKLSDREPVELLGGLLYLTHARNSGAAYGFAQGATVVFTIVAALVVVVIVRTASRLRSTAWAVCLGLILGGAAGNLVDRIFRSPGPLRGAVVDWISVNDPHGDFFPIFNIADSGITVGGALAVLLALLGYEMDGRRHRSNKPSKNGPKQKDGT